MKTKKLVMPLAFMMGMLLSVTSYAVNNSKFVPVSGIPFTIKYLNAHHFVAKNSYVSSNGIYMWFGATQSGLYDDWTITVSNDNFSCTWHTTDPAHGTLNTYETYAHHFYGRNSGEFFIPPGIYNVTLQCNNSNAYRTDITVSGDNNTFDGIQNTNPYNTPFVATGIEIVNGGYGIDITTTTNY
jgi:hypothetical protein